MKTAFVTGATAGIGLATVRTLVANGWRCVATGRRQERLDALVAELGADKVHAACFDVRDTAALDAALAALPEGFRDIDLLVNNAGLAQGLSPAQNANLDDWHTMIDTNITAMVVLTNELTRDRIAHQQELEKLRTLQALLPEGSYDNDLVASCRLVTSREYLGSDQPMPLYTATLKGVHTGYALMANGARGWLSTNRGARIVGKLSGITFFCFGVLMASASR